MGANQVQGQNGKLRSDKRDNRSKSKDRVVSMRAWRAKKRIQYVRGTRTWPAYVAAVVNYAMLIVTGLFAISSCIPVAWQVPSIICTWFFAVVGSALSLLMYVNRDRFAKRALALYSLGMALSMVAAIVKLQTLH